MIGDVRTGHGRLGGGQVVGVGLTGNFVDHAGNFRLDLTAAGEPLGGSPTLNQLGGGGIAFFGQLGDDFEVVENQHGLGQLIGGEGGIRPFQLTNQERHVVTTQHLAEELDGFDAADERGGLLAVSHGTQPLALDLGGGINAGGHAIGQEVDEELFLTGRRGLQQGAQGGSLLGVEGQGGDALLLALGGGGAVVGEEAAHRESPYGGR